MTTVTKTPPPKDGLVRAARPGLEVRAAEDGGMPKLTGYMLRFNEWTEIDSIFEGRFLERVAPGAAKKTLKENESMRILFNHGRDPHVGEKPLAPPKFGENAEGVFYDDPELFDTSYNRDLVPGLEGGQYGSSFKFRSVIEEFDEDPGVSEHNPDGIPERTIKELRLYEGGPVVFPAYAGSSAGVRTRSLTDQVFIDGLKRDPTRAKDELGELFAGWVLGDPERARKLIDRAEGEIDKGERTTSARKEELHAPWAMLPELMPMIAATVQDDRDQARSDASDVLSGLFGGSTQEVETANGVAIIPLRGVITPRGSLFGGGGLEGFREQLHDAVANEDVDAILLDIDSPGGSSALVAEAAADIREAREEKPVVAVANARAASAAFWLASQASEVVVTPSGEIGSVGVFLLHEDYSQMDARRGVKTTLISAGKYKTEGNPYEPLSDEAKATFQAKVEEVHDAFLADLAKGRGTTTKDARDNFGEGRMVGPKDAVKAGMADRIESRDEALARLSKNLQGRSDTGGSTQEARVADAGHSDDEASDDARDTALPQDGAEASHSDQGSRNAPTGAPGSRPTPPWHGDQKRTPPWRSTEKEK